MVMDDLESRLREISKGRRVTEADVEAEIASVFYCNGWDAAAQDPTVPARNSQAEKVVPAELRVITLALVTTKSGFTVIGTSGCADPANFNREIGEQIARRNAVSQLWGHMGYALRQELYEQTERHRAESVDEVIQDSIGRMGE
jgi:hypothetical protein